MTHYILKISIHIQTIERLKKIMQVRKFVAKDLNDELSRTEMAQWLEQHTL